jgi:tRNA-modifying protein YgfZ
MEPSATTTFDAQYQALRSGCGVVELRNWTSVTLTGADRHAFLHNFCTNDVKRLAIGESCEAFFTNVKGKIIGHGLVTCRENELVIVGEPGQTPKLIEHLDRYVIREDVQLRDTTAARGYLLICGKRETCVDFLLPRLDSSDSDRDRFGRLQDFPARLLEAAVYVASWYRARGRFFVLIETAASSLPKLKENLAGGGLLICNEASEIVRIEAGIPLYDVDFDDRNFPQEVGRNEEAISFTKGCYLGQETVARIDALGHVNQQLAGVRFTAAGLPEIGAQITDAGKTIGRVTSAVFSPKLQAPLGLAMVRREHVAAGTRLDAQTGPCEIVSLPV